MKFLVSLLLFLFISCSGVFAQIEIFSSKAQTALDSKEYQTALEYCNKVLAEDSLNFKGHFNRALAYYYLNQIDKAIYDFNYALAIDSTKDYVYHFRGLAWLNSKKYQEAIIDFSQSIALNPKNTESFIYKGNAKLGLDKIDEAIECYTKAIKINTKLTFPYLQRGNAHLLKKDFDLAIKDFSEAEKNGYKTNKLYFGRGYAYFQSNKFKEAIKDYSKAIEIDSNDVEAYNNRAICYNKIGDKEKARSDKQKKFDLMSQGIVPSLDNVKFKRVSDERKLFSFEVPDNWNVVYLSDSANSQVSVTPENVKSVEDYYRIGITAGYETQFKSKYGAKEPEEILEFWKQNSLSNSKNYAHYETVSTKTKKYNGFDGIMNEIVVQTDSSSATMHMLELIIPFDNAVIYIFFQSPIADSPFFKKIYETTIRSLQFVPPPSSSN